MWWTVESPWNVWNGMTTVIQHSQHFMTHVARSWGGPKIFWNPSGTLNCNGLHVIIQMKNHEGSKWIKRWTSIHESTRDPIPTRTPWPLAIPGPGTLGFGLQVSKAFRRREISSRPSSPVVQNLQVLMAACQVSLSWRTSISSISTHGHFVLGFLLRMGSYFMISPKRTFLLPTSFRLMESKIFFRMPGNMIPRPDKNVSVTVWRPPCFTTSSRPDWNRAPSFSLLAHSASSSTSQQSCSSRMFKDVQGKLQDEMWTFPEFNLCIVVVFCGV